MKSVLAVADGSATLEAVIRAAGHIAELGKGQVEVLHVRDPMALFGGAALGAASVGGEAALPILMEKGQAEIGQRATQARKAYDSLKASLPQSRFIALDGGESNAVVAYGRLSDLIVVGRPGADEMKPEPGYVPAAIFDSARPVMIVPPQWKPAKIAHAVVAWNGSAQAARALGYAISVLKHAGKVTILSVGKDKERPKTGPVAEYLARHGVKSGEAGFDAGSGSARSRGRALINYAATTEAGLLVMGAYGQAGMLRFLGLGGATGKIITGCPVPVFLAH